MNSGHHSLLRDELVEQLRSENAFLRGQLEVREREASEQIALLRGQLEEKDRQITAWIDEAKRKDMLPAHLQERIVELPADTPAQLQNAPERPERDDQLHNGQHLGGVY